MARREEGTDPRRSVTDEQRSQRAISTETRRAAALLPPDLRCSLLTDTPYPLVARASAGAKIPCRVMYGN